MSVMAAALAGPRFSIGRTIADSFRILARNILVFAAAAFLIHLIWLLAPPVIPAQPGVIDYGDLVKEVLRTLLGLLVSCLMQLAFAIPVARTFAGQRSSVRDVWPGFRSVVPVFAAGVVSYAPFLVMSFSERLLAAYPFAKGLSSIPLFIVMSYFILNFWLTTPVIALERIGILASLKRSRDLIRGARWKILAIWLLVGIMVVVVTVFVSFATGRGFVELVALKPTTVPGAIYFIVVVAWGAFFATLTNVAYHHLQVEKEGSAETTARIFD